ncbi:E3 ubiquitin-protein ligase TRIM39-like isoform X2 [Ambystoma mexicanum]|uniref:E3 ubiquitin-protein ligase TRIM39-like isoform X2 n=1 Tax=Ambystoma mexicanum TaxID=8296 RepID=UPI0037E85452
MAAAAQLQSLKEEATCSICLEYFTEPVSVECGHAFCLSCITQCWEGLEANFPCPQCRETSQSKTLRPYRQLGNMVEIAKQLQAPSNTPQEENMCREHEEKLKLFCEDDQRPICVVCSMSRDHKPHTVLPISEAAQEYKGNIMKKRESILSTFEHLKQFLEKEKQQLLSRLEKEQEEKMKKIQEKLTRLEEQQSTHWGLITELQRKCQQQDVDLLKDVKSVLRRCSEVKALKPQEDAAGMETTLQSTTRHAHLQEKLTELKETFPAEMDWRYMTSCEQYKASMMSKLGVHGDGGGCPILGEHALPFRERRFSIKEKTWRPDQINFPKHLLHMFPPQGDQSFRFIDNAWGEMNKG